MRSTSISEPSSTRTRAHSSRTHRVRPGHVRDARIGRARDGLHAPARIHRVPRGVREERQRGAGHGQREGRLRRGVCEREEREGHVPVAVRLVGRGAGLEDGEVQPAAAFQNWRRAAVGVRDGGHFVEGGEEVGEELALADLRRQRRGHGCGLT